MVKKPKAAAGGPSEMELAATIKDSAQQIWLAGLGAFSKAHDEGNKVFEALVREGESIQKRTRKVAEIKVSEITARATGTWDKLEQVFEDRIDRALHRLGVPTKSDVDALAKRVAQLGDTISAVAAKQKAQPAKRAPAAKKAG